MCTFPIDPLKAIYKKKLYGATIATWSGRTRILRIASISYSRENALHEYKKTHWFLNFKLAI